MRSPVLLTAALLVLGVPGAPGRDAKRIEQRLKQIKESGTTAWRSIPWAPSLTDARQQSAKEKRPVFLFTHAGNLETGRC